jgi:hypothetical protein
MHVIFNSLFRCIRHVSSESRILAKQEQQSAGSSAEAGGSNLHQPLRLSRYELIISRFVAHEVYMSCLIRLFGLENAIPRTQRKMKLCSVMCKLWRCTEIPDAELVARTDVEVTFRFLSHWIHFYWELNMTDVLCELPILIYPAITCTLKFCH